LIIMLGKDGKRKASIFYIEAFFIGI